MQDVLISLALWHATARMVFMVMSRIVQMWTSVQLLITTVAGLGRASIQLETLSANVEPVFTVTEARVSTYMNMNKEITSVISMLFA